MRTSGEGSVEERRQRPTRLAATFRTFRKRGISRAFSFFFFFFMRRVCKLGQRGVHVCFYVKSLVSVGCETFERLAERDRMNRDEDKTR